MDGIGQNLQFQSDGSEMLCAIRPPHKTCAYHILWQNMSYLRVMGKDEFMYVPVMRFELNGMVRFILYDTL